MRPSDCCRNTTGWSRRKWITFAGSLGRRRRRVRSMKRCSPSATCRGLKSSASNIPPPFAIVESSALLVYQLPDTHWWSAGGRLRLHNDFWEKMNDIRSRIPAGGRDISFDEFLKRQRKLAPRVKQMARGFAEGFNAAHAD